ncbi:hypothetical protein H310_09008 [Aphanomyces invadans]|uniref:Uncharacterized protein n=1 Tax=Aphanomyces invadans TaxID=157072 RepID=A0A024TY67_9STRA|nr:hypothetical protein H310_09008 [Aphanomyces invadans]ETV98297.1 hypothetical protein H310_09008 [Aphanomyces invadans]|eukprot:XP_008873172.1 hypothetical protein H310_09008 [Aphanomyces invadans]
MALPLCNLTRAGGGDNSRRACAWQTAPIPFCNTSSFDWAAICSQHHSTNWRCCGLARLDVDGVAFMWSIFLVLAVAFSWYSNMVQEFQSSVDDLHDIPTQALGVVVARQKKHVLGRTIHDPRRIWVILSIVIEIGVFSYVPLQLILYDITTPSPTDVAWEYQVAKFAAFAAVLVVDVFRPRRMERVLTHVIRPLVYDTGYTTILYAIIDIGACSSDMDSLTFPDGSTCAHPERYWHFVVVASMSFAVFFWRTSACLDDDARGVGHCLDKLGTLLYKMHFSDQVFAVRFRFQTSYYTLMTYCRTACCLFFITIQKFILYVDDNLVYVAAALVNFAMFYLLLRYNYKHQPCLGVGKLLNTLRSVAFAMSCYFSVYLGALSVYHIARGTPIDKDLASAEGVVSWCVLAMSFVFLGVVWRINDRRASLFEIPNMSLEKALDHPNHRVKAVAAVSLTLEDQSQWSVKYKANLVAKLHDNLNVLDHDDRDMTLLYTCQAMWTLWRNYFTMAAGVHEGSGASVCLPFGLWEATSRFKGVQKMHVQAKVADVLREKFCSFKPTGGLVLKHLVDSIMTTHTAMQSNATMEFWSYRTDPVSDERLRKIVAVVVDLVRSTYAKTRYAAAKILHDMYTMSAVQLTDVTMIYVLCTMVSRPDGALTIPTARTLCKLYALHWKHSDRSKPHFVERLNMQHLSQFVASHRHTLESTVLVGGVMQILFDCTKWIEHKQGREDPAVHFSAAFIANLIQAQAHVAHKATVGVFFLVDDIVMSIRATCLRHMQRVDAMRTLRTSATRVMHTARVVPEAPVAGPSLRPVHHHLIHSWGTVTKQATRAHRLTLVAPAVVEAARKRSQLRDSIRATLTALVEEGYDRRVAADALSSQSCFGLVTAMHAWMRYPLVVEEALTHFAEGHVAYLVDLLHSKIQHSARPRRTSRNLMPPI